MRNILSVFVYDCIYVQRDPILHCKITRCLCEMSKHKVAVNLEKGRQTSLAGEKVSKVNV